MPPDLIPLDARVHSRVLGLRLPRSPAKALSDAA
jgi:hypothetical protein